MKRCKVCGSEYETCYVCEKVNSWRIHTDTAEHYYILCVLMEYQTDHDAKRAYRALRKRGIDFKKTDEYVPSIQKLLSEIYDVVNVHKVVPQEEPVHQENPIATNIVVVGDRDKAEE